MCTTLKKQHTTCRRSVSKNKEKKEDRKGRKKEEENLLGKIRKEKKKRERKKLLSGYILVRMCIRFLGYQPAGKWEKEKVVPTEVTKLSLSCYSSAIATYRQEPKKEEEEEETLPTFISSYIANCNRLISRCL